MKKNLLALLTIMTVSLIVVIFVSCSSDDDSVSSNKLVGTWVREYSTNSGTGSVSYEFYADGTGMYRSGDVWGDFTYKETSPGFLYIKICFVNSKAQSVWRDEYGWNYSIDGDRLWLDGKWYIRK